MQGVYADINICATKENMALYPMSDDRVQYAELNYHEVNNPVTTQKVYESGKFTVTVCISACMCTQYS